MQGEPKFDFTPPRRGFPTSCAIRVHLGSHTSPDSTPPVPRPQSSSVRKCRHSDCANNVPLRCPVGFCRAHCTSPRCQDHADGRRPRECRARGCHAMCGVRCTVGGPRFVLMSVALFSPVLLVCSELVLNIAIIPNVCAVRPDVSHPRDHQGFVYASCSHAVNLFMPNAAVGIAHCIVPVLIANSMRPQTGPERDSGSGERGTREVL